jgi:hypothetical protein
MMANGDAGQFEKVKSLEVVEFWHVFKQFKSRIKPHKPKSNV